MELKKGLLFGCTLALATTLGLAGCGGGAQTSQPSQGTPTEETASQETEAAQTPEPSPTQPVKASVEEYSWDELSQIAQEISALSDEDAAIALATEYHLCSSSGELDGTQTKTLELSDGTQATVQIVGFYHDDKTDGGKAGITFMFDDAIANRPMNSEDTNAGGWEDSTLRSWLASDGMGMLPADLQGAIASVDKLTNNVGETTSASSVTSTSDKLWAFSIVEVFGDISFYSTFDGFDAACDSVLNAEGSVYQFFDDMDVDIDDDDLTILLRPYQGENGNWWMRSPIPETNNCFFDQCSIGYDAIRLNHANDSLNVVPGFCL